MEGGGGSTPSRSAARSCESRRIGGGGGGVQEICETVGRGKEIGFGERVGFLSG
jgi:hypothetical protein